MISFPGALLAFTTLFALIPLSVRFFILTFLALSLGVNFLRWAADTLFG